MDHCKLLRNGDVEHHCGVKFGEKPTCSPYRVITPVKILRYFGAEEDKRECPEAEEFLAEIKSLCRRYNISISHEDFHGAFLLEPYDEKTMEWLMTAGYAEEAE